MAKIHLSDEAVEALCLAIVHQAAKDYMAAYSRYRRLKKEFERGHPYVVKKLEDAKRALESERKYFFSADFEMLSDLDPSTLIRLMEDAVSQNQKYL